MKKRLLLAGITIFSIAYIFAIPNEPTAVKLVFKLIPMVFIIFYAYQNFPFLDHATHHFILTGLVFSIIGDGTLHWFVIGLSAFLIGHVFYICGFYREISITSPRISVLFVLLPYGIWIGYHIIQSIQLTGDKTLIIPVILYIAIIMVMGFVAMLTGNKYAIWGSILFIISDSILAWNKFVAPITYSSTLIMTTYYAAQLLIAMSLTTIARRS